jgi:hypothetical protein
MSGERRSRWNVEPVEPSPWRLSPPRGSGTDAPLPFSRSRSRSPRAGSTVRRFDPARPAPRRGGGRVDGRFDAPASRGGYAAGFGPRRGASRSPPRFASHPAQQRSRGGGPSPPRDYHGGGRGDQQQLGGGPKASYRAAPPPAGAPAAAAARPVDSCLAGLRAAPAEAEIPPAMSWEVFWSRRGLPAAAGGRYRGNAPPPPPPPISDIREAFLKYQSTYRARACERFFASHQHEEWFRER